MPDRSVNGYYLLMLCFSQVVWVDGAWLKDETKKYSDGANYSTLWHSHNGRSLTLVSRPPIVSALWRDWKVEGFFVISFIYYQFKNDLFFLVHPDRATSSVCLSQSSALSKYLSSLSIMSNLELYKERTTSCRSELHLTLAYLPVNERWKET